MEIAEIKTLEKTGFDSSRSQDIRQQFNAQEVV
jgi:hypothetical protein